MSLRLPSRLACRALLATALPPGGVPAGRQAGARLVSHAGVDKVAFTGSTAAGRQVAAAYGTLLGPVTLEVGGKSAAIVLDDADLDVAIGKKFVNAPLLANGQACFAGTRVPAPRSRYDEVVEAVSTVVGGPFGGVEASGMGREFRPEALLHHRQLKSIYL